MNQSTVQIVDNPESAGKEMADSVDKIIHELASMKPGQPYMFVKMTDEGAKFIGGLTPAHCLQVAEMLLEVAGQIAAASEPHPETKDLN